MKRLVPLLLLLGCPTPPVPAPDAGTNPWKVVHEGLPGTLLSAWESSDGVLYAVGGAPASALVLRHDANGWWQMDPGTSHALWWVHGYAVNDVYAVGAELYAVGGLQTPVLLRSAGGAWRALNIPGTPQLLNGVAVNMSGEVVIVGLDGYLAQGRGDSFEMFPPLTRRGLHGATVTKTGFVAVGGELLGTFGQGVLLAKGELEGGALQPWPYEGLRFDAGVDAGQPDAAGIDAGPPDGGWLGPGALCQEAPLSCEPPMECWFVFGPYTSFCASTCRDDSDCGAYGVGACCKLPGPQVSEPVCLPFDAGVCDAGS